MQISKFSFTLYRWKLPLPSPSASIFYQVSRIRKVEFFLIVFVNWGCRIPYLDKHSDSLMLVFRIYVAIMNPGQVRLTTTLYITWHFKKHSVSGTVRKSKKTQNESPRSVCRTTWWGHHKEKKFIKSIWYLSVQMLISTWMLRAKRMDIALQCHI